jgi:hypothetical protein
MRAETGPMEFADDWTGVFVRGDNALGDSFHIAAALEILDASESPGAALSANAIRGMMELLAGARQGARPDVQKLRVFSDCVAVPAEPPRAQLVEALEAAERFITTQEPPAGEVLALVRAALGKSVSP